MEEDDDRPDDILLTGSSYEDEGNFFSNADSQNDSRITVRGGASSKGIRKRMIIAQEEEVNYFINALTVSRKEGKRWFLT